MGSPLIREAPTSPSAAGRGVVTFEGIEALRQRGPYFCTHCGNEPLELPGVCDPCGKVLAKEQVQLRLRPARQSIPEGFRVMRFGSAELQSACRHKPLIDHGKLLVGQILSRDVHMVLIDGKTGAGKTSLACAMADMIIEGCSFGPGCRFVFAPFIARAYSDVPYGQSPEILRTCHGASVLVVDDLGQDAVYRDNLRTVIQTRDAERKPTIITTFLDEHQTAETYGGGIARRLFNDCARITMGSQPARRSAPVATVPPRKVVQG